MLDLSYEYHHDYLGFIFALNNNPVNDTYLKLTIGLDDDQYMNILKIFNVSIAKDNNTIFYNEEDIQNAIVTLKILG